MNNTEHLFSKYVVCKKLGLAASKSNKLNKGCDTKWNSFRSLDGWMDAWIISNLSCDKMRSIHRVVLAKMAVKINLIRPNYGRCYARLENQTNSVLAYRQIDRMILQVPTAMFYRDTCRGSLFLPLVLPGVVLVIHATALIDRAN